MADFILGKIGPTAGVPIKSAWPGEAQINMCQNEGKPILQANWAVTGNFTWQTSPNGFVKTAGATGEIDHNADNIEDDHLSPVSYTVRVVVSGLDLVVTDDNWLKITIGRDWTLNTSEERHSAYFFPTAGTIYLASILAPQIEFEEGVEDPEAIVITGGVDWIGKVESVEVFQMTGVSDTNLNGGFNKIATALSQLGYHAGLTDPYTAQQHLFGVLANRSVKNSNLNSDTITTHAPFYIETPIKDYHPANKLYVDDIPTKLRTMEDPIDGLSVFAKPVAIITTTQDMELVWDDGEWNVNEWSGHKLIELGKAYESEAFGSVTFLFNLKREWVWNSKKNDRRTLYAVIHQSSISEAEIDTSVALVQTYFDNKDMQGLVNEATFRGTHILNQKMSGGERITTLVIGGGSTEDSDDRWYQAGTPFEGIIYNGVWWALQYFVYNDSFVDLAVTQPEKNHFSYGIFTPYIGGNVVT